MKKISVDMEVKLTSLDNLILGSDDSLDKIYTVKEIILHPDTKEQYMAILDTGILVKVWRLKPLFSNNLDVRIIDATDEQKELLKKFFQSNLIKFLLLNLY